MALPKHTELHYKIWHYVYLTICASVFFFLIAPLFVIFPLSFNAEMFLSFSEGMLRLDPDAFSTRWYKDMIYGTKNPWGLAARNSFIIAIFATIGSSRSIPSEKLKNISALKDNGKITNKGAIKKKKTEAQIVK